MLKKWITAAILAITAAVMLTACGGGNQQGEQTAQPATKIKVATSFNAMKEFVQVVGKDKVDVVTIIPDGTEPHDFELLPKT